VSEEGINQEEGVQLMLKDLVGWKLSSFRDPYIIETSQKTAQKCNLISPKEQKKMFTLHPQQIEPIQAASFILPERAQDRCQFQEICQQDSKQVEK
jgi:hypothetical protein